MIMKMKDYKLKVKGYNYIISFYDNEEKLNFDKANNYASLHSHGWEIPSPSKLEKIMDTVNSGFKACDSLYLKTPKNHKTITELYSLMNGRAFWSDEKKDLNYAKCVVMNPRCSDTLVRLQPINSNQYLLLIKRDR